MEGYRFYDSEGTLTRALHDGDSWIGETEAYSPRDGTWHEYPINLSTDADRLTEQEAKARVGGGDLFASAPPGAARTLPDPMQQ